MLDDSSQSSFKPCPQGSGSLTPLPFHDSAHTMYDPGQLRSSSHSSTNGSGPDLSQMPNAMHSSGMATNYSTSTATAAVGAPSSTNRTHDMSLFKMNAPQNSNHFPNSSVFLENSDILDDKDYPKLYHRHSTIIIGPDSHNEISANRRYSDTKLLHAGSDDDLDADHNLGAIRTMPIFNVATVLGASIQPTLSTNPNDSYTVPQITDIIFENNSTGGIYDPLELNIQEMLELDTSSSSNALNRPRHSMHNVAFNDPNYAIDASAAAADGASRRESIARDARNTIENRNMFKSMPNLSASSENLLQK